MGIENHKDFENYIDELEKFKIKSKESIRHVEKIIKTEPLEKAKKIATETMITLFRELYMILERKGEEIIKIFRESDIWWA